MSIRHHVPLKASKNKDDHPSSSSSHKRKLKAKLAQSTTIFNAWWITGAGVLSGHVIFLFMLLFYTNVPAIFMLLGLASGLLGKLAPVQYIRRTDIYIKPQM